MNKIKSRNMLVLLSPAHYFLTNGISEFGWPYKAIENIKRDFDVKFFVIVNSSDGINIDNVYELGKGGNDDTCLKKLNFYTKCFFKSLNILKKEKIDIIHHMLPFSYENTFNLLAVFNIKKEIPFILGPLQNPPIFSDNGDDDKRSMNNILISIGKPVLKKLFIRTIERADRLIVVNDFTKKLYEKYVPSEKIEVIPPGVDIREFNNIFHNAISAHKEILYVGQLIKRKGIEYLLYAFQIVCNNHKNVYLRLIGNGLDIERLKELSNELKISDKVIFEGYVHHDEIIKFYEKCDIFVLPSLSESFGQVLLEAMACRRPCIASNIVGPNEIIIHEKTGYLFPSKDYDKLAEYISVMIENDELRIKMGINGRKLVEEKYDWKIIGKKYHNIYKDTIKRRNK